MTNSEVFHAFASRSAAEGNSVRSKRVENGAVLYSYATPIAFFLDTADVPVFTSRKFSRSTSKQATQAKAIAGAFEVANPDDFRVAASQAGASFAFAR